MEIVFEGFDEIKATLKPEIINTPMRRFCDRVGISITNKARPNTPVNDGQLRATLTHQVDSNDPPEHVSVGWPGAGGILARKAAGMEFGTGTQSDGPGGSGKVHFPPWGEQNPGLEIWARKHGFPNGFLVARAIGRRGGLKPRRMVRNAVAASTNDIARYGGQLAGEIVAAMEDTP